jgi:hypothetical protein
MGRFAKDSTSFKGLGLSDISCLICGAVMKSFRPTVEDRIYHECPICHWIALDPKHFLTPEAQKERYLQHENSDQDAGYVAMFEDFIATCVEPFVPKGGLVLDYGSGPEPVLAGLLAQKGYQAQTFDLFFDVNNAALKKPYDAIVLTEVLEHLSDPVEVLKPLATKLKPGGVVALMTLFHPKDREKFGAWWYRRDKTHVTFYTVETMRKLAAVLGLTLLLSDDKRKTVLGKR